MRNISILVIEENMFLREKIAGVISRINRVDIVSQMARCPDPANTAKKTSPDLVLLDIKIASQNIDTLSELKNNCGGCALYLTTDTSEEEYIDMAASLGADALVEKKNVGTCVRQFVNSLDNRETTAPVGDEKYIHKEM